MRQHDLLNLIVSDCSLVFTLKFWLLLYYFLGIKQSFSLAFFLQINSQTKKQKNTIEAYLRAFVNFKQNNWARLLSIAKFAHNKIKNVSTSYTIFEFNYDYHFYVFYEKDIYLISMSKFVEELSIELGKLITIY